MHVAPSCHTGNAPQRDRATQTHPLNYSSGPDMAWGLMARQTRQRCHSGSSDSSPGNRCYYLFLLQSDYCRANKLCQWCHQPGCKARHQSSCQEYRLAYRQRPDKQISRPSRGYTTLSQAVELDPMAHHYYSTTFYH